MYFIEDLIGSMNIVKMIIFIICFSLSVMSFLALLINILDWLSNVLYFLFNSGWFQWSYPNLEDDVINIHYVLYITNEQTGEIFYIDKKRFKKLKKKHLIKWDNEISCYVFSDKKIKEVRQELIPEIIKYEYQNLLSKNI